MPSFSRLFDKQCIGCSGRLRVASPGAVPRAAEDISSTSSETSSDGRRSKLRSKSRFSHASTATGEFSPSSSAVLSDPAAASADDEAKEEEVGRDCSANLEAHEAAQPPSHDLANGDVDEDMARNVRQLRSLLEPGQPLHGLSDFAKEYGDEAFCKRILRKYDGDMDRARERFSQALRWREQNEELLRTRKFALAGDYRVIGADLEQRPVLYMCMKNQLLPNTQGLDHALVCMLQAIDNMPTGVEKTIHIWDLHGMSMRLNWNPTPLASMLQAQEGYFAERLHELIIIDVPRGASLLKEAVWPVVPSKTRGKVRFFTPSDAQEHFRQTLPAEDAARLCAAVGENRDPAVPLERRRQGWRRVDTRGALVPLESQSGSPVEAA